MAFVIYQKRCDELSLNFESKISSSDVLEREKERETVSKREIPQKITVSTARIGGCRRLSEYQLKIQGFFVPLISEIKF